MFSDIKLLQNAGALARYSAARQEVIAKNIANADTPGFKAKDLEPFADFYARNHEGPAQRSGPPKTVTINGHASPNGNSVSLEEQMWRAGSTARQHDTAVTLYAKAINLLRISLGGGR